MSYFALTRPGERPRLFIEAPDQAAADQRCDAGEVAIGTATMGDFVASADGRSLLPHIFPLPMLKLRRWNDVKALRAARIAAGLSVPGIGLFDIDAESRAAILAEAMGLKDDIEAGQAPVVQWKMKDNAVVTDIAAASFVAAARAIRLHHRAIHHRTQELGQAIEAADGAEALDAIDIGAGWPPA